MSATLLLAVVAGCGGGGSEPVEIGYLEPSISAYCHGIAANAAADDLGVTLSSERAKDSGEVSAKKDVQHIIDALRADGDAKIADDKRTVREFAVDQASTLSDPECDPVLGQRLQDAVEAAK